MSVSELRLRDMQEERQRRQDEHTEKLAAVTARREEQETQRISKLKTRQERKQQRQSRFQEECRKRKIEYKESQRSKEKGHELRMAVLNAEKEQKLVALREKIEAKVFWLIQA
ncbi:S phase cyclin A-associated protein in the endoplasmic reticulum-like [Octopus sinensis]|uniref:S phase cyclin A-associated protein in the endoplasmic reticulum-like n=1 Tax=Octopus sinensis TaxID=2607531 RepID=A0A7E6EHB7_9MOLL|nr:S phase cyclin A-associated protein in the endoplasmic reticulum-like [Octopus sinensis]